MELNLVYANKMFISNYEKTIPEEPGIFLRDKKYPVLFLDVNVLQWPATEKDKDVQNRQYEIVGFVLDERNKICAINMFSCDVFQDV